MLKLSFIIKQLPNGISFKFRPSKNNSLISSFLHSARLLVNQVWQETHWNLVHQGESRMMAGQHHILACCHHYQLRLLISELAGLSPHSSLLSPETTQLSAREKEVGDIFILSASSAVLPVVSMKSTGEYRHNAVQSAASHSWLSRLQLLLFLPSSSSIVLTRLRVPRSRPTTSHKIW
jgi:hypothetical protein